MGIAVIILTHQHAGRFQPFIERITSDILPAWNKAFVFFSAKQRHYIIMQPPATIMAYIHHYRFLVAITSQQFGVDLTEARTIHTFYMNITDTPTGQFLYCPTAILHPSFIEKFTLHRIGNWFDSFLETFLRIRIIDRKNCFTI